MTYEEKIRSMTTEELAKFLCKFLSCDRCPGRDICYLGDGSANGLQKYLKKYMDELDDMKE